jgi:hypothetical protein
LILNVSTVGDDPLVPQSISWALAEPGVVDITTLDESRVVATLTAEVVSLESAQLGSLTVEFDFTRN